MGTIWAGRRLGNHHLHSLVAVKIAHPQFSKEERFRNMFLDEARLASAVQHPNVCMVFDVVQDGELLYLVMEWIGGGSLHELLGAVPERRLDCRVAARIVAAACAGLHAAHELRNQAGDPLDLIHRDVSPHNILLTIDGKVKLTDFGVARARDQLHQTTSTGEIKGKLSYIAPEQFGSRDYDRRVDVFSLGCVLYRAIVGRRAFDGSSAEVMYALVNLQYDRPRAVVPEIPPELEAIVVRAMSEADKRYASAEAMKLALESWLATQPPCSDADVAAVVKQALERVIENRRGAVATVITQIDSARALLASARVGGSGDADATQVLADGVRSGSGSGVVRTAAPGPARGGSRRALWGAVALALVVIGLGGAWRSVRRVQTAGAGPTSTVAGEPVASAAVASSAMIPVPMQTSVSITLRTNAPNASVSIDDGPSLSLPMHEAVARDSVEHVLRISAPGYHTEVRRVSFAQSLEVEIPLTAAAPARPPRARAGSTPPVSAPHPPATSTTLAGSSSGFREVKPPKQPKPIDKDLFDN